MRSKATSSKISGGVGKALRRLVGAPALKHELIAEYKNALAEIRIHKMVAAHLNQWKYDDVYWWHTPNGEKRDPVTAAKLKQMGVMPGIHDILAIHRGRIFSLELKRSGEKPKDDQLLFAQMIMSISGSYAYADNFDAAVWQLEQWGLLRIKTMGK